MSHFLFAQVKTCIYICDVRFDDVTGDGRLWAVKYDGQSENILTLTFRDWYDIDRLESFFRDNINDLESWFHITDVDTAIYETIEDAHYLQCMILDISPEANLDDLFRPLENNRAAEMRLGREKAKVRSKAGHQSWLRLYALKLEPGAYLITGGAIKLTRTMAEREHTLRELMQLELVRNYLIDHGAFDTDGVEDISEEDE